MTRVLKNKLTVKDLGSGHVLATQPDTVQKVVVGYIIGTATGIGQRTAANGVDVHEYLSGTFEGTPTDPGRDTVASGVLYLPEAIQTLITEAMKLDDRGKATEQVKFVFEVSAVRATNPQSYTWAFEPMGDVAVNDPLAEQRALIDARIKPALEGPKKSKSAA